MSLNKTGDLARARGNHADAEAAFKESLTIDRDFATRLDTPEARRDLSVSLNKVGGLAQAQGDHAAAEAAFKESLSSTALWQHSWARPRPSAICRCLSTKSVT